MRLTVALWTAAAVAIARARALSIESSGAAAPPEDIVGEHQPLQRVWHIASLEELEKLHVLVPGRVFIDTEAALAALETPAPTTAAPVTPAPVVVVEETDAPETDAPETEEPETEEPETDEPEATVVPPVADVGASGSSDDSDSVEPSATEAPEPTDKPTDEPKVAVGSSSLEGSSSGSSTTDAIRIDAVTTQLRRRDHDDKDSDDDSDEDPKKHKKHHKPTEAAVAKIVVTGNSSALLDLFEVLPLHPRRQNGLKLQLKNADAVVEGFVLTQIVLSNANYLRHLRVAVADAVVVGAGVLVEDDKDTTVKIAASGAASVLVQSSARGVALGSLRLDVAGSGMVQLQAPALRLADTLDANVVGSGAIGLLADASLAAATVEAAVSGAGKLVVQTRRLAADSLAAAVYGEGVVSVASAGNVTTEKLTLSGSGSVLVGSIAAARAAVDVWGSGTVVVQVADKLKVSTSFSGSVGYVGARPARVQTSKWLFWRSDIVHPAPENTVAPYDAVAAPARYPTYAALVMQQTRHSDEPRVTVTTAGAPEPSYVAAMATHLSAVANGPNGFLIFSMVATTLVAVGLAVNALHTRHVRRHYRPLV